MLRAFVRGMPHRSEPGGTVWLPNEDIACTDPL
jgi:hypothetical protein